METEITAYCRICKRNVKVKSIYFGDDQSMGLELECGDPKSYDLTEHDLSSTHEWNARWRERDRKIEAEWQEHLREVEERNKAR